MNPYTGGGDDTDHSSVSPFHGLFVDTTPFLRPWNTFTRKMTIAMPITPAPTEANRFMRSQCVSERYVYVRRGMPFSPSRCIGKNVRLNPAKSSQKVNLL